MNDTPKIKECFVIMPISDIPGYESGHFDRVYNYLIAPACKIAGFLPKRADEVKKSNFIVLDILRKIVETDLVICDLSGKNPNCLYELGIRQAFNKPSVLIKDDKTERIFDIQGLRDSVYDSSLRIDIVENYQKELANVITETMKCDSKDINSLVQLLGIQAAQLPTPRSLDDETILILNSLENISQRLTKIEKLPNAMSMNTENKLRKIEDILRYTMHTGSNLFEDLESSVKGPELDEINSKLVKNIFNGSGAADSESRFV